MAKMVEEAGASAVTVHGRTAAQSYSGLADWDLVKRDSDQVRICVSVSGTTAAISMAASTPIKAVADPGGGGGHAPLALDPEKGLF